MGLAQGSEKEEMGMSNRRSFLTKSGHKLEVPEKDIYKITRKTSHDPDGYITLRVMDVEAQHIMEQLLYADGNADNSE